MEPLNTDGAIDTSDAEKPILVVGSANMDLVVSCERFPEPGETILADHFGMYPGGKGANQAVAAAKLGGHVRFLGKIGRDDFGERLLESLSKDGVSVDQVVTDSSAPTGVALISVNGDGENEIIVVSGSNMELTDEDLEARGMLFDGAAVVLLQLEIPLATVEAAAIRARAHGATVILNPAPAHVLPAGLLQQVDYLTPNETEAGILTGISVTDIASATEAGQVLRSQGVKTVIVTLGAGGALIVDGRGARHFPTRKVEAVDTTGAGDAFNGALAFALADGRKLDEAVRLANEVASFSVTRAGAQSAMPSVEEITSAPAMGGGHQSGVPALNQ
jgi:ribokinase